MEEAKKNFDFIDLLKSIAIYFVLIYHFNNMNIDFINQVNSSVYFNYFISSIFSTCVPIFFFVNGALLLNKSDLNIKSHLHKIFKIAILIIIWGAITLTSLAILRNEKLSAFEIIKGTYLLRQGWNNHLWFLQALIVIYILFPLFFSLFNNNKKHFDFILISVLILTFGNTAIGNFATILSFMTGKFTSSNLNANYFSGFNPFGGIYGYSIGYFLIGGVILKKTDIYNTKRVRLIALISLIISMCLLCAYGVIASKRQNQIWDIVWSGYDTLFTAFNVIALFVLTLNYKHKSFLGLIIKKIAENSLGIYFLHVITGNFLKPYYVAFTLSQNVFVNFLFALFLLIFTLLIVLGLKKVPFIKYLFLLG